MKLSTNFIGCVIFASSSFGNIISQPSGSLQILPTNSIHDDAKPTGSIQILPNGNNDASITPFPFENTQENIEQLSQAFELFESIPQSILNEGVDAVSNWTSQNIELISPGLIDEKLHIPKINGKKAIKLVKCVGEIVLVIKKGKMTVKQLKTIKDLIQKLGGAKKVAGMLLKAKNWNQLKTIGGPLLKALGQELKGWKSSIHDCFGF